MALSIGNTNLTLSSILSNMSNLNAKPFTPSKNSPLPYGQGSPGGSGNVPPSGGSSVVPPPCGPTPSTCGGGFTPEAFAQALVAAFQGMSQAPAGAGSTNNMASVPRKSCVVLQVELVFVLQDPILIMSWTTLVFW